MSLRAGRGWVCLWLAGLALQASANEDKRSERLQASVREASPGQTQLVWVYFGDKPAGLAGVPTELSTRALQRRALRGTASAAQLARDDQPVAASYVSAVQRFGRLRHVSRWFNAASLEVSGTRLGELAALPFVRRIDLVARYRHDRREGLQTVTPPGRSATKSASTGVAIDYGLALGQLQQLQVPAAHALGLDGTGVVVAMLDSGFSNLGHAAFTTTKVLGQWDFVNGDADVADGTDRGEGSHGTATLSVIGGYREGILVGPAYRASFLLAKTEDTDSETPIEEDNWAAAAEWAEAQGADVISSSLGYLSYDSPFTSYTWQDLNGQRAISTLAAEKAAERGVVVVISAGNAGLDLTHNTLGAPADGVHVLTAGGVDSTGARASFSSVGPTADLRIKPDVAAQAQSVLAAWTGTADNYARVDGTSFACPLTAGVVALLLQAHPEYTVDQVLAVMRNTASQAQAPDNLLGWGIVNALAAVQAKAP